MGIKPTLIKSSKSWSHLTKDYLPYWLFFV
jgi:hypothetical protein